MKRPTIQTNIAPVIALIAGLSLAMSAKATVPISDLPDFDNLPNFAQLGNNLRNAASTVNGNVGVSSGGSLTTTAFNTINGDLYVAEGASSSGPGTVTGSTFAGVDLTTEQNTVFSASEGLSALSPDEVISSLQTGSLSFDIPAGQVYVVNLNGGLNLTGPDGITVTGGGALVLNVGSSFAMSSAATILGPSASDIFINYTGASLANLSGADINGQLFFPSAPATFSGGVVNGGVFGGNSAITLTASQTLNGVPVPEPGTMALAAMGGISIIILRRRLCSLTRSV